MLEVVRVPALSDNYIWLMHDDVGGGTVVIDPAEAAPVLAAAEARGWRIDQIWNTHWHPDHVGGNADIRAAVEAAGGTLTITGPKAEAAKIPTLDVHVEEGDTATIGTHIAQVIDVPAHTAGHIAYHIPDSEIVFTGDTLFAMGCGRLFEGTADQMFDNMQKLKSLPADTQVYCAHEYTQSNGRFALVAEPGNDAIRHRMTEVDVARTNGEATVPTSIALERETNPFMRAESAEELAKLRAAKDAF